ncbi:MAG: hypothetical protein R6V32_11940 [Bacteroidales bacterium]
MVTFQPIKKDKEGFEGLSASVFAGEKDLLMKSLNESNHAYGSFSQFVRSSININLEKMGIEFRLTEK